MKLSKTFLNILAIRVPILIGSFCICLTASAEIIVESTTWAKYNNVTSALSDTTSTDGRIPPGTNGKGDDVAVVYPAVVGGALYVFSTRLPRMA
ncbi:MAG: hypothetical protein HYV35_09835 [Lentisphaerae bacterium]|nr:hypothetical protein [Lentisphaerota bacterium]